MIYPALEMAVDDDIIRKNPAKFSISDYGRQAEERIALTVLQQEKMLEFVKNNQVYNHLLSNAQNHVRNWCKVRRTDWIDLGRCRCQNKSGKY